MKLIEQLAKEYGEAGNHYYPDERDVANAFEAGFRKARDMAVEKINEIMPVDAAILIEDLGEAEVGK